MASKSKQKGNALEKAIRFIQETILQSDAKFAGTKFRIEVNKVISVNGVRHEFDVYIEALPDSDFEAKWVFECKNWKKPVGKNEVIVFSEKIKAIAATRGFLVAKSITKDAEAQLKQDARTTFVQCSDDFVGPFTFELSYSERELLPIEVLFKERGITASGEPVKHEWENEKCVFNGKQVNFASFVMEHVDEIVKDDEPADVEQFRNEGTHFMNRNRMIEFGKGEFSFGIKDMEHMVIKVRFFVRVTKRKIISKFELKDRGRFYSFEPLEISSGKKLEISVVHRI